MELDAPACMWLGLEIKMHDTAWHEKLMMMMKKKKKEEKKKKKKKKKK